MNEQGEDRIKASATGHGKAFFLATGRWPQTGDVGCGFAYKTPGTRKEDPSRSRELQWDSYTFNHGAAQGIDSDFHTAGAWPRCGHGCVGVYALAERAWPAQAATWTPARQASTSGS